MTTAVNVNLDPADHDTLLVSFPWRADLLELVKGVAGRRWLSGQKVWAIPFTPENVEYLRTHMPTTAQLLLPPDLLGRVVREQRAVVDAADIRSAGDSGIQHAYVTEPYAHQRAGLGFLAQLGSGALLWEMGLGKTKTAIDYAEWLRDGPEQPVGAPDFRVLVIAPNTVLDNWGAEIRKHAGHADYVIGRGSLPQRARQVATARYTIVNTEVLSGSTAMTKALAARVWDLIVVDESTRFKNPRAARTKNLLKLRARHRLILTGTPMTNSPEDIWAQLTFVTPGLLGTWWAYRDRYLVLDHWKNVVGIRANMETELRQRIESRSYRRLKADVLDLPEKVYVDRIVDMGDAQRAAYTQMQEELRLELPDDGGELRVFNLLTQLLRLTQITAGLLGQNPDYVWMGDKSAKVVELDHLLNEELAGEQVVIFGQYQRELEELATRYEGTFDGVWPPILYGPTPPAVRSSLIEQFQAGDRRLLFAHARTGGIGINLTAARTAIYYTRSWSLEDYLQSQDRLHRIGQTGTVTIIHLVARKSIDEDIAKALAGKQSLADRITGDELRRMAAEVLGGKS